MTESTGHVKINLITILVGLSFQWGVQYMVADWGPQVAFNGAAYLLMLANFYHGKMATCESREHIELLDGKPKHALVDYILNILVILSFAFMPYFLKNEINFLLANIAMRVTDWVLVWFTAFKLHDKVPRLVHKAQMFWLKFNAWSVIVFVIFFLGIVNGYVGPVWVAVGMLGHIILDLTLDYWKNARLYFGGEIQVD